ncbi:MAG: YfhO family protein [Lachnospiraceae bacterium]|nr:YfhO family protein [Lachnospiraceae bacterium]
MMDTVHITKYKRWLRPMVIAFIVPVVTLFILYVARGIFPFGERSYMRMDFYHQYAPFMKEFCRRIREGESLWYAWEYGLGTNYWAHYAYYLASPINWLLVLVPAKYVVEAMNFSMVLRAGIAGATFVYFLKEDRKEEVGMAAFGVFYGLSGFYMAYACNIIWLDGYVLFPLVALGVMRIAKGKSAAMYIASMLLCTFSNFYLAVIIGMCCVVWLIICLIVRRKKTFTDVLKAGGKFILATLLYVAMCAVILLPAAYALMNTPAGDSSFPEKAELYFPLYELFERMCMNVSSNLKGSDLPNIYASVLVLFLLPMYFGNSTIRLRNKVIYGLTLIFMLVSFDLNVFDYVWHGLHFPNSFPARQSFFYIFLVLMLGYEAYARRKRISKKQIWISLSALLAIIAVAWVFLGKDNTGGGMSIYLCTIIFVVLYGLLFGLEKKFGKRLFLVLFVAVCCLEAGTNTYVIGLNSVVNRAAYMNDDAETKELLVEYMPGEDDFYRMEEQDRKTVNDAGWDGYYGASYFSSTMPGGTKEWYDAFGFRNSSVSYSHEGATPLTTSLLGIKYVFAAEEEYLPGNTYTKIVENYAYDEVHIYENQTVLPLGYVVDSDLENGFEYNMRNPFETQNRFVKAVLGEEVLLFTEVSQNRAFEFPDFNVDAGAESDLTEEEEIIEYTCIEVAAGENVFLYVNTYMEAIDAEFVNENGEVTETHHYDDLKFKRIVSLGVEDTDRVIRISSGDDSVDKVSFMSYKMNEDVLWRVYEVLNRYPMEITEFSEHRVKGRINAKEAGVLLLSVPYDEGWSVTVDGEAVETFGWKDAFLAAEISEGEHEIAMAYCPKGFKEGLLITIAGVIIGVAYGFLLYKKKKTTVKNI